MEITVARPTIRGRIRAALSLNDTPVGRDIPRPLAIAMALIGLAVIAIDLELIPSPVGGLDFDDAWPRVAPACVAILVYAVVARRAATIGIRVSPLPSPRYWLRATLGMLVVFAVIVGISTAVYVAIHGVTLPARVRPPQVSYLRESLIHYPLVEELIYRWVLVTGLAALGLRWTAVLISGVAFGYLHFKYGAAAPNNVAAGFVFAWMYLRSGSVAMPVLYHSLGNAIVFAINVAAFALLT